MAKIIGNYIHEKSENIDEYFKSLGVPYLARKMMLMSNPRLEISKKNDKWTIKSITMMRTQIWEFNLNSEYEEFMPNGTVLKNTTSLEGDSLITISLTEDGNKLTRRYDFTDDGAVLTLSQERSDQVGKRFFKRIE